MENLLIYSYFITLALIIIIIALLFFKQFSVIRILGLACLVSVGFSYIGIYLYSGHLPTSGSFEKLQNIVFILILIGSYFTIRSLNKNENFLFWFLALFFQTFVLLDGFEITSYFFMYDNIWVILFFQLRIISIALFTYALSSYITVLFLESNLKEQMSKRGRNFTLLGAIVFLSGEFSGSYWALLGWGDPWRWSKGFFLASAMFLLSMAVSHLPSKISSNLKFKALISASLLVLILLIFIF